MRKIKNNHPKVSVFVLTYNQAEYVQQAIDSILMQETDFKFEILINDDASTDGTRQIVEEYEKKYPKIIKAVHHNENQFNLGYRNFILKYLIPLAKGEYYAICEGDDYWIDKHKLQKQARFLDNNYEYTVHFHSVKVVGENDEILGFFPEKKPQTSLKNLLKNNYIQTNSVMYRSVDYSRVNLDVMPGDWYLHLYHAKFGKIAYSSEKMAAYRRHSGGMWWESQENMDNIWRKYGVLRMKLYFELLELFGSEKIYRSIIQEKILLLYNKLATLDNDDKSKIIDSLFDQITVFGRTLSDILYAKNRSIEENYKIIENKSHILAKEVEATREELRLVKSSKAWKARNIVAKRIGKQEV